MNNSITLTQPDHQTITTTVIDHYDLTWLNFFDTRRALMSAEDDIKSLPGSRTAEGHTWKSYSHAIYRFLAWGYALATGAEPTMISTSQPEVNAYFDAVRAGDLPVIHPIPRPDLLTKFVRQLMDEGLSSSTINNKYRPPIRKYLSALADQEIDLRQFKRVEEYMQMVEWRETIRRGGKIKRVKSETTTNQSALYATGTRLTPQQVNAVLRACDRRTLAGKRDYALLLLAFSSGLRGGIL